MMLPFALKQDNFVWQFIKSFLSSIVFIVLMMSVTYFLVNLKQDLPDELIDIFALFFLFIILYLFGTFVGGNTFLKKDKIVFLDIVSWYKKVIPLEQIVNVSLRNGRNIIVKTKDGESYSFFSKTSKGYYRIARPKHYKKFSNYLSSNKIKVV